MTISGFKRALLRLTGRRGNDVQAHFEKIYKKNLFGGSESRSGTGSSLVQTERIRRELPSLLKRFEVDSFLDAPCGDCNWISGFDWTHIDYTGVDVVSELIKVNEARLSGRGMRFLTADLCGDALPRAKMIFCRDCWVHLDHAQIRACLANFRRSGATYLMTTTFTERLSNRDLGCDIWRPLNLSKAPFNFPVPLYSLVEGCTEEGGKYSDKSLGVWRIDDLVF